MTRLQIFCEIDDFCLWFVPAWESRMLPPADRQLRRRESQLCLSEIMTILVLFHRSNYRTCKHFYLDYVCVVLRDEFPTLVSYTRFIELIPGTWFPCAPMPRAAQATSPASPLSTPLP